MYAACGLAVPAGALALGGAVVGDARPVTADWGTEIAPLCVCMMTWYFVQLNVGSLTAACQQNHKNFTFGT